MANISTQIESLVKVARPIHWVKNLSIFAALIFTGNLFNHLDFVQVFWAFIAFNLAASTTYIFNDIKDVEKDRLHPIKKNRPLASGNLSVEVALFEAAVLCFLSLWIAHSLSSVFFFLTAGYLVLQVFYSLILKNLPVIDIIVIASGFVIRIYAGAFVIDAHLSVWFLLCVISVALFLASGKRRAELGIVKPGSTRKSLLNYPKELLNSYVTMFGNAAWMSWALFSFFESPKASLPLYLVLSEISRATTVDKLLMLTIPITIFGIMRYEALIFEGRSEAPEKLLLTDMPLVASVALWTFLVVWVFYSNYTIF